ncbi:telomeric repeat-binding factor 2-like isoform X2 [Cucurbita maxima]|uniref:Telomeric repeat-binding factor 2-like isoform X2 n=1 Tax=Cucurbita maxima TaxID=3661 RepID=A0A6J1JCD7_CUCMA|nr:telomeric repeat-binding factor 2-like isoform X2 [Cucurbita maxima]
MNEDICRWITEFILRSSMDDHLLKRVLAVIPLSNKDFRLKKTVLLRAIESEISEAVITDKLLEIFEMIEQLEKAEGLQIMESMKAAYCAVAVECTVKYLLVEGVYKHGRYFDAVRRIWRGGVTKTELVSDEFKAWKDEVEASLCDANIRKKLVHMNTRYDALKLIGDYLGESWAAIGPSFLQLSASLVDKKMRNEMHSIQLERETNILAIESVDVGGSGGIELPSQRENCVKTEWQGSGRVLSQPESRRTDLLHSHQDLGTNDGSKQSAIDAMNTERVQELATETAEGQESAEKEVAVLQNASSCRESVAHDLAEKNKTCENSLEDRNDAGVDNPTINKEAVPLQPMSANLKDPGHGHKTVFPRPSIMERNSTACTYEWNDSIDDLPEGSPASRLHLHSPKRKAVSPLKKYEETKAVGRRRCKKWSLLEEDTLRTAVQRFGKGNWKLILNSYRDIFDERTEVDLKDKWRNMTRY